MAQREKVFLGRDNAIKLGLLVDGTPINASVMTRIVATLTNNVGTVITIDSAVDTNVFDTTQSAQVSDTTVTILVIKLQDAVSPPAPANDYIMDLVLYDPTNPDGIRWDDPFPVQVIAA